VEDQDDRTLAFVERSNRGAIRGRCGQKHVITSGEAGYKSVTDCLGNGARYWCPRQEVAQ
jgi:hypothetical protein